MGGSNRAGARGPRSEQNARKDGSRKRSAEATVAETTAEAATMSRDGARRSGGARKRADTKTSGSDQGDARGKSPQRRRGSGGGSSGSAAKETTAQVAKRLPVREDEEQWNAEELEEVRGDLEQEVSGLKQEIERAESEIAERLGDPSDGAGDDQADTGAKTFEREHEMSLANNARDLLAQNERAIQRIEAGTYGVCERCGNPVGKARLQAFPRAALCVSCKQREERR